jgi:malto-oligosyltrehalose trehalohydrolase
MRRVVTRHLMPFGAETTPRGVRFRLWAPAARTVELVLEGATPRLAAMPAVGGGWFEATRTDAAAGSRYRFRIDGDRLVPDPASRHQPDDVHGPSVVVDPAAYPWIHELWRGRPWHEAVIYELHVGTFTTDGTFDGVRSRLDHLVDLGVTAIELMPIADFSGTRNWGYDGVFPFAPDAAYGTPDDLKRLVDAAHGRGLMMLLDFVYNHFGPEGNYLQAYAPEFFTDRFETPWGAAIDFARREVRDFVIHNALYWLEEYRFDGLRLDAVHAINDDSEPHILEELAETARRCTGIDRHIHLVLENEHNAARYLERKDRRPRYYTAQWNDDVHHAFHVLATGERAGYYDDFADAPLDHLARSLAEGFAFQGDPFRHWSGAPRGEPSAHLPATAFIAFLQNHDQVGNRAFGERIGTLAEPHVLRALIAVFLLAPSPPLLFMGEEWGAPEPFLFFCDFHDTLADAVREGRRSEFAKFPEFQDAETRRRIPDPNDEDTFLRSRLNWEGPNDGRHVEWLQLYRRLLHLRHREIVPRLTGLPGHAGRAQRVGEGGLAVVWRLNGGSVLRLLANLASTDVTGLPVSDGDLLYATADHAADQASVGRLPPWSAAWFVR